MKAKTINQILDAIIAEIMELINKSKAVNLLQGQNFLKINVKINVKNLDFYQYMPIFTS